MFVKISNNDVPVTLGLRKTLVRVITAMGPPEMAGITEPVNVTLPVKPAMLESVIFTNPVEPSGIVRETGLVMRVKSGTGAEVMVRVRVAMWVMEPLVAVKTI